MIRFALAMLAALALAGCQTTSIDTAIQKNLPQICSAAATAHASFTASAIALDISERTQRREKAAWDALKPLCVNPSAATSGDVLVAAVTSYATIAAALRDAKK